MEITLTQGDITEQQVDAIVNAANSSLLGGGGVDGAIHRAGGPEILAECRALRAAHYGKGLPTGQAVATTAGRLPARWVIHTVGPVHPDPREGAELARRTELLASCYRESLRIATELGARSVALPAVSTGVYGWPMESAARIALAEVMEMGRTGGLDEAIDEARFVLFGADAYGVFERVLQELSHGPMVD
ncbi:O-acetyl-ADP-ribose deacetylase [Streptacidiphilus pinicola]|uniref:O-acetyl-ADP-ribose deacetylase n=1 Tax=Streptacidiphilus pinicola TaxID=2219663 RepID=A0A2X0I9G8_9ACTN|nr:O-acetyl-ADP-ribose deacetylase [Streptacidiphilus pinicola]RAG81137.1 O-acetyl-ADP-ribose deacetylase [Streptacidiphilus pinicola]